MGHYRNFELTVYCPAGEFVRADNDEIERRIDFFQRYAPLDKAYLEMHRGGDNISPERMREIKALFEKRGIKTAGGYTSVTALKRAEKPCLLGVLCYTDKEMLEELQETIEATASVFDELILDDFYFTNCTCESCRALKGSRSWAETRMELMDEVSRKYVIEPAKRVNPACKVIIKYPNWNESYHECGYDPIVQHEMFDGIYTGTEARQPGVSHQHLSRYMSYSLPRLMENLAPGKNGGGWFDWIDCGYSINGYLEQMYLTAFSHCRELMMFCMTGIYDTPLVPALGFMVNKIDMLMDGVGGCIGLPAYTPFRGEGEDHIIDDFGMCGFALEPVPYFPKNAPVILVPESAVYDSQIVEKLKVYCAEGGKAFITVGFLRAAREKGYDVSALTAARVSSRTMNAERYGLQNYSCGFKEHIPAGEPVSFPIIEIRNNADWNEMVVENGAHNAPIYIRSLYGKGELRIIDIPEDFAQLRRLPKEVLTAWRKAMSEALPVYLECAAENMLFVYDNDAFIILRHEGLPRGMAYAHIKGSARALLGRALRGERKIEPLYERDGETVFELMLEAGDIHRFAIER